MKHLKKALVFILAIAMMVSSTGCSDLTWSFKMDDTTVSIGTYIFYEYSAFYDAAQQVTDSEAQVLEQKIDDIPAEEWIRDKALESIEKYLAVEKLMKDMNLKVSDEDKENAESYADMIWNSYGYGTDFENYGISLESYCNALYMLNAKDETIFKAIYGKDGTKGVSDEELKKYFTENYTDYYYFTYDLSTTNDDGESVAMSEDEIAKVKEQFDGYVEMMTKKDKSYTEVVNKFIEFSGEESTAEEDGDVTESSPSNHHTTILNEDSMLDEEVRNKIIALKDYGCDAFIYGEGASAVYYFVYKTSITDRSEEFLKDEDESFSVLQTMKGDEYDEYIKEVTKTLEYETNEKALKKYSPDMFTEEFLN